MSWRTRIQSVFLRSPLALTDAKVFSFLLRQSSENSVTIRILTRLLQTIPHNAAPHELCAFGKVEQLLTAEASVEGIGVVIASWVSFRIQLKYLER